MLGAVEHIKRFPPETLDPRTRRIIWEELIRWRKWWEEIYATVPDHLKAEYEKPFKQDLADSDWAIKELERVRREKGEADEA